MAKLRLVKERQHETDHDSDLRGLGNDPLLSESTPVPVLSFITDQSGADEIQKKSEAFPFNMKFQYDGGALHVSIVSQTEQFKESIVELFGLMLFMESTSQNTYKSSHLWTWDRMRQRMEKNTDVVEPVMEDAFQDLQSESKLEENLIHNGICIYLRQAGFGVPRNADTVTLTDSMVDDNLKSLSSLKDSNASGFKKGGMA